MEYEPGTEYDCDACGGTHVVRRGKGLRVAGSSERLDPAPYVRCPEAGVVPLSGSAAEAADGEVATGAGDDPAASDDADDWP